MRVPDDDATEVEGEGDEAGGVVSHLSITRVLLPRRGTWDRAREWSFRF